MPVSVELSENSSHSSSFPASFEQYTNEERQRRRETAQHAVKRRSRKVPILYASTSYDSTVRDVLSKPAQIHRNLLQKPSQFLPTQSGLEITSVQGPIAQPELHQLHSRKQQSASTVRGVLPRPAQTHRNLLQKQSRLSPTQSGLEITSTGGPIAQPELHQLHPRRQPSASTFPRWPNRTRNLLPGSSQLLSVQSGQTGSGVTSVQGPIAQPELHQLHPRKQPSRLSSTQSGLEITSARGSIAQSELHQLHPRKKKSTSTIPRLPIWPNQTRNLLPGSQLLPVQSGQTGSRIASVQGPIAQPELYQLHPRKQQSASTVRDVLPKPVQVHRNFLQQSSQLLPTQSGQIGSGIASAQGPIAQPELYQLHSRKQQSASTVRGALPKPVQTHRSFSQQPSQLLPMQSGQTNSGIASAQGPIAQPELYQLHPRKQQTASTVRGALPKPAQTHRSFSQQPSQLLPMQSGQTGSGVASAQGPIAQPELYQLHLRKQQSTSTVRGALPNLGQTHRNLLQQRSQLLPMQSGQKGSGITLGQGPIAQPELHQLHPQKQRSVSTVRCALPKPTQTHRNLLQQRSQLLPMQSGQTGSGITSVRGSTAQPELHQLHLRKQQSTSTPRKPPVWPNPSQSLLPGSSQLLPVQSEQTGLGVTSARGPIAQPELYQLHAREQQRYVLLNILMF